MRPLKMVSVVGARPQFVKAAVVSRAIGTKNDSQIEPLIREVMVHTGQHYDENMSDIFFRELDIAMPAYYLGVGNTSHGKMTGRMLERVEEVLVAESPDLVLVYGDTNSTLAGALAAVKLHIRLAHVEAGLRSCNMAMPEEINRILADRVSHWLFCPTAHAASNLMREGIEKDRVFVVGDVMFDAVLHYRDRARLAPELSARIAANGGNFCLATVHRAENTDDPEKLRGIVGALEEISKSVPVILPLHPRTRARLTEFGILAGHLHILNPVGYLDMIALLRACSAVFTDSGGLQKEAFFFRKPCVTLRAETEWLELVELGVNVVAGTERGSILEAWTKLSARTFRWDEKPYGEGNAGSKIIDILLRTSPAGSAHAR